MSSMPSAFRARPGFPLAPGTGVAGSRWRRAAAALAAGLTALLLVACGGGGGGSGEAAPPAPPPPQAADPRLEFGNDSNTARVLSAVPPPAPAASQPGSTEPTTLTVHYRRSDANYAGWQIHTWNAAVDPGWNNGHNAVATDGFGAVYRVPLAAQAGTVGYLFHKGDDKDHGGADQSYQLKPGANEIWRIQGDPATYTSNPQGAQAPDIDTVRVRYRRFGGDFAAWGLHLWNDSGLDVARLPAGTAIDQWNNAVRLSQMPAYAAAAGEVVFEIPVRNPRTNPGQTALEFIIHGLAPNENDKDGRPDNIRVDYASLRIANRVGEVWLVERDATVYTVAPDLRRVSTTDARAFWLNRSLIQWPRVDASGTVKLYHSATGQVNAGLGGSVTGADGSITLEPFAGTVPAAVRERFKWIGNGAVFTLKAADQPRLATLLKSQLVLVQEDASGKVQNATTAQLPGALDDLYAAAASVPDLGVSIRGGQTRFRLWAPTAQKVLLFTYDTPTGAAVTVDEMTMDAATGVWAVARAGDLSGKYYRFAVETFARGVGLVRNLVTDPYSLSLSTDSARSYVADLDAAALKPAGWDASSPPAKVAAATDMVVYELHVRDFSASDTSVSAANRGKYLAFGESTSRGMQHLKALADAGVTDVHLLPTFDIASVPEAGCTTPAVPAAAVDSDAQQAAVRAGAGTDCFNWGYDPWHFGAPEGSYSSDASDGARRIVEFRRMVMGLHAAGLRVGMDVVYNHTTASGQNARSVLDRVVPGYYHRLADDGAVVRDSCCDDTATEHLMMAKLMSDTLVTWARDYKISSFRFDLMGLQPRPVMEEVQRRLDTAAGRRVQLFGEGWNIGVVRDDRRFVQARLGGLGGSGIGAFGDKMRDAVRGGGCCDSGNALATEQGFMSGLHFDPNAVAGSRPLNDLRWRGDLIKAALAGSIHDYTLRTHWDADVALKDLDGAGYVREPGEVVNYVENHDNHTLYDINALRLPLATSREDRARVQILGAATVAFSQGVAYYHAGVELLRSKSGDRNSYDSGDWFNVLDWSGATHAWGTGVPPQPDNGASWELLRPFLRNAELKAAPAEIDWTRRAFNDLLRIRSGTTLLRLRTAQDIRERLRFLNTGGAQVPTVLVGHVNGVGYAGATWRELVYFINAGKADETLVLPTLAGKAFELHPVQAATGAADRRVASGARVQAASGSFTVPARTAVVFVLR